MNMKLPAVLTASAAVLLLCTACSRSAPESGTEHTAPSPAVTTAAAEESVEIAVETTAAEETEFEEPTEAKAGDAYLSISDKKWYVQYNGSRDDILTYDAGIARITGDGDYTVSVNAGTKGAQFDITGNPDSSYVCSGIDFAAIRIPEGNTLYPDMVIEIREIRVNGKAIEMTAKNYTSSDDGTETRANIYNHYISIIPDDGRSTEGSVAGEFGAYSSMIVSPRDFSKWTTVEVDFTVTGTGETTGNEESAAPDAEIPG